MEEKNNINSESIKLDYTLETPEERNELVKKIVETAPPEKLTPKYQEILADYIIFAMTKEEKKAKKILTDNRMVTINKRETSFEGLSDKLENGEDGIYNMLGGNNKHIIFKPKIEITEEDVKTIPGMKELKETIENLKKDIIKMKGKDKFIWKKQLIALCQQQQILKNAYLQPMYITNKVKNFYNFNFDEKITIKEDGTVESDGAVSFFNPEHISALLRSYISLRIESRGKFSNDTYFVLEDLDNLIKKTLKEKYPLYYDLMKYKMANKTNAEIQELLYQKHNIKHSIEYISSLWRNKIPKLLAEQAQEDYLMWYYTEKEKGKWKKCSRCGQIKLAHSRFFSKNKTSRDGFYSICKECRNKKATIKIKL